MKILVLTTGSEEKSARRLGFETHIYWPYNYDLKNTCVIRWGNGYQNAPILDPIFSETDDFDCVLNKQKSIELNVNKPEALKILNKVVPTPIIYKSKIPSRKYAILRTKQHSSGQNFQVVKGPLPIPAGHYATSLIRTNKEVRIFLCGNKTMMCSREKAKKNDSDICRSNYAYVRFRKVPVRLHRMAIRAAKALQLDLGAFDVLVKKRKYYFLEFNSAVTCEKKATDFYKQNIPKLIKKKFPHLFTKEKTKPVNKVGRLVKMSTNNK